MKRRSGRQPLSWQRLQRVIFELTVKQWYAAKNKKEKGVATPEGWRACWHQPAGSPLGATSSRASELSAALPAGRSAFIGVAVFSALLNVLYLTGSFFMLRGLRPRAAEPERADPGRPLDPRCCALRLPGRARHHPQPRAGPRRQRLSTNASTGASTTSSCELPLQGAARRRPAAAARPRSGPLASCPASGRPPCSTCRGCRSISASASSSIR